MAINKQYKFIKKMIKKYRLKPTTQRNLPLLSQSIITLGYTIYLKQKLGYSYEVLAFIGRENWFHSMMGEKSLSNKTREYLKKNRRNLNKLLLSLILDFKKAREKIFLARKIKNKKESIKIILENYLQYMRVMSTYNCFWRYIGNKEHDKYISDKQIKEISRERDMVAKFYPEVEKIILPIVQSVGKSEGFDGTLLQYLSYLEFGNYLKRGITKERLEELKTRKAEYFYVFEEKNKKEIIITDKKIISRLRREFYEVKKRITEIKGFPACAGFAKGKVFNISQSKKPVSKKYILVAPSTHPKDIKLIKGSMAIVVDEGGILSHAAVISRELKIPCVIGTKIATKVFKDGDKIEVDAERGIVRKL